MSCLVLDASISLAWLPDNEDSPIADAARVRLATNNVLVPGIYPGYCSGACKGLNAHFMCRKRVVFGFGKKKHTK